MKIFSEKFHSPRGVWFDERRKTLKGAGASCRRVLFFARPLPKRLMPAFYKKLTQKLYKILKGSFFHVEKAPLP